MNNMSVDKMKIYELPIRTREKLGVDRNGAIDIFSLVQNIPHLSLVLYPLSNEISGMCIKRKNDTIIIINSQMSVGRQNFSIAHELYHYYFDETENTFICNSDININLETEQEANQFASYLLIPIGELTFKNNEVSIDKIIEFEQYYRVSHQALLYRLLDEGLINHNQMESLKNNITKTASRLGFDISLYKDSNDKKKYKTYGYYIKQVQKLQDKDIVSNGKYEQLLLDAFRGDIVYGEDEVIELND